MYLKISLRILLLSILLTSCKNTYKFELITPGKVAANQALEISLVEKNGNPIDSVQFSLNGKVISRGSNLNATINLSDYRLGKHAVSALVFYDKKTKKVNNTIYSLATKAPDVYDYKIVNSFPHDQNAYTQGLEYHDGFLYESTGRNGTSSLRKVELETGKVLQQINLSNEYFGEGITKFGDKIFMLTWRKGVGFIYDADSFEQLGSFDYKKSLQGWGLTNDGERLIKTDGTERIWFLNSKTQVEEDYIEAYTNKRKVEQLNELEYIDGKIYANIYQQNSILIVDASNGQILGVADLNGLKNEMAKTQKLVPQDEVLNGIAYDKENDRLFVTGKNWGKLFEIELIKRQ